MPVANLTNKNQTESYTISDLMNKDCALLADVTSKRNELIRLSRAVKDTKYFLHQNIMIALRTVSRGSSKNRLTLIKLFSIKTHKQLKVGKELGSYVTRVT